MNHSPLMIEKCLTGRTQILYDNGTICEFFNHKNLQDVDEMHFLIFVTKYLMILCLYEDGS